MVKVGYLLYLGSVPAINLSLKHSLQSMHQHPQQSACWRTLSSHLSALGMSLPQTKSLHVAVCFPTGRLLKVCSGAWGRSFPCHIHCLGSKHPDVCTRSSHHSALGMSLPRTTSVHVVICFPTGRLILRGRVSSRSVLMHGVEASPCHLNCLGSNIQTSVCIRSVALPELGSPNLGVDILNR